MKKILITVLVVILVFAFATTALADSGSFTNKRVYGGASQTIAMSTKDEPNSMDLRVTSLTMNGQSNFIFRGYGHYTGIDCTYAKQVTGTGYFMATYTWHPDEADMRASIASSSTSAYLYFSGNYYI